MIGFRVTKAERRSIKAAAKAYKISVTEYLKMLHRDRDGKAT